jgi:hypothetical protein
MLKHLYQYLYTPNYVIIYIEHGIYLEVYFPSIHLTTLSIWSFQILCAMAPNPFGTRNLETFHHYKICCYIFRIKHIISLVELIIFNKECMILLRIQGCMWLIYIWNTSKNQRRLITSFVKGALNTPQWPLFGTLSRPIFLNMHGLICSMQYVPTPSKF